MSPRGLSEAFSAIGDRSGELSPNVKAMRKATLYRLAQTVFDLAGLDH